jgi:two-component system sensor histidine kinase/response regulator
VVELLAMFNITAVCAVNGREAVERFETDPPGTYALILMDIQMPHMDGYQATRRIRAMERSDAASIPIVAMTANAFTEDIKLALEAGMNQHMAKPIDIRQLETIMFRWLG